MPDHALLPQVDDRLEQRAEMQARHARRQPAPRQVERAVAALSAALK
jgi:hypothetical protein